MIETSGNVEGGASSEDGMIGKESMVDGLSSTIKGKTWNSSFQKESVESSAQGIGYNDVE